MLYSLAEIIKQRRGNWVSCSILSDTAVPRICKLVLLHVLGSWFYHWTVFTEVTCILVPACVGLWFILESYINSILYRPLGFPVRGELEREDTALKAEPCESHGV